MDHQMQYLKDWNHVLKVLQTVTEKELQNLTPVYIKYYVIPSLRFGKHLLRFETLKHSDLVQLPYLPEMS